MSSAGVLIASGAQQNTQPTHAGEYHVVPFVGVFSGKTTVNVGAYVGNGPGVFTVCGRSQVQVSQPVVPNPPYFVTISAANGDTISLLVAYGSNTYQIEGGTGSFANVVGGTGHFSLKPGLSGQQQTYTGYLYGTIVTAPASPGSTTPLVAVLSVSDGPAQTGGHTYYLNATSSTGDIVRYRLTENLYLTNGHASSTLLYDGSDPHLSSNAQGYLLIIPNTGVSWVSVSLTVYDGAGNSAATNYAWYGPF